MRVIWPTIKLVLFYLVLILVVIYVGLKTTSYIYFICALAVGLIGFYWSVRNPLTKGV
ncbi:MAG: hypothetical protein WCW57_00145 [Candidatus Pacearchaeota archaeon]